jgi:hypothetical protein
MENFDDIRPYNDSEVPAAMRRITESDAFPLLASWVYPDKSLEWVRQLMLGFTTVHDFQFEVMKQVDQQVIDRTISKFTFSGFEQVKPDGAYLFVSNHRDIMLDAALLQYILVNHGCETTEITFGANLMSPGLVTDIGKSNKMFRVERGGRMRDFYQSSVHLSNYIRRAIVDKRHSVWIAQRNGRTKNGNDRTDQGIIKMFCLSDPDDKIRALSELHIIPMSVSYEYESCDVLKAVELYESRFQKYIKHPGEDLNSILTGVLQNKGRVNISLCPEITEQDLRKFDDCPNNEYHKRVAELIDRRIIAAYMLTPYNFVAHDMRYSQQAYRQYYTEEQKAAFLKRMARLDAYDVDDPDVLKDIFLGIYANPLQNKKELLAYTGQL